MIATCKTCGKTFETTEEDANHPGGTECVRCHRVGKIGSLLAAFFVSAHAAFGAPDTADELVPQLFEVPVEEDLLEEGRRLWEAALSRPGFPEVIR